MHKIEPNYGLTPTMFCPDGPGNIFIPLGIVTWHCNGQLPPLSGVVDPDEAPLPTTVEDSDEFPRWLYNLPEGTGRN